MATRRESFVSDIHAREQVVEVEYGVDADGRLLAMKGGITAAVGPYSAFPRSSVVEGGQVLRLLPGPYRVGNYDGAFVGLAVMWALAAVLVLLLKRPVAADQVSRPSETGSQVAPLPAPAVASVDRVAKTPSLPRNR